MLGPPARPQGRETPRRWRRSSAKPIRLRPDYAEAHNNLGLVLLQSGDDAGGIAALREAVRIAPDYADAHANLGAALTPDRRRRSRSASSRRPSRWRRPR